MSTFPARPPHVAPPPALEWVLFRALGPADARWPGPVPEGTIEEADRLGLAGRVGSRNSREVLSANLGREGVDAFRTRVRRAAAGAMLRRELCAYLASQAETNVVFLKGVALDLAHVVPAGFRQASDIDVLLSEDDADRLWAALKTEGWTSMEVPTGQQHLPTLAHPEGLGNVEIHWRLRGFEVEPGRWAGIDDLRSLELLTPVEGMPGRCFIPTHEAMIAHLVTHALDQHFWFPGSYPQLRFLADLQDLGWNRRRLESFSENGFRWIARHVAPVLLEAVTDLLERFEAGEAPGEIWVGDDPAGRYLRHVVLGVRDPAYREALRLRAISHTMTTPGRRLGGLKGLLGTTFWMTRGQIDQVFGKPESEWGYWGRRLIRPFDVAGRFIRYGASWLRVRMRGRQKG